MSRIKTTQGSGRTGVRWQTILVHILGWLLLVMFVWSVTHRELAFSQQWQIRMVLVLCTYIAIFYLNSLILVPRLLIPRKSWTYSVSILSAVFAVLLVSYWIENSFPEMQQVRIMRHGSQEPPGKPPIFLFQFFNIVMFLGISTSLTLISTWYRNEQERLDSERQRLSGELRALKSQVHPHFFFNTLNNIHSLIEINTEQARSAVLELSRLMRYLLYESDESRVSLQKELQFIHTYINLMKLRLTDSFPLSVTLPSDQTPGSVAPLMMIPVIENVFKYGISYQRQGPVIIHVSLKDSRVFLLTENPVFISEEDEADSRERIGLANLRRRLELLYPDNFLLEISETENRFRVELSYPMDEHG